MGLKKSLSTWKVMMFRSSSGSGVVSMGTRCAAADPAIATSIAMAPTRNRIGMSPLKGEHRRWPPKVPSAQVGGSLWMPEVLAPARHDRQRRRDAHDAVERPGEA